jgi:acetylornithine deacetylase/succinyl-diaminopimelate desuccinylase-like protein
MLPPTPDDERMLDRMVEDVDLEASSKLLGIGGFIPGRSRRELLTDSIFGTSLNMDGIFGGLTTPGTAGSIMPNSISSKHNCRYVPNQDGAELLAKVRRHLDAHGYGDIEINVIGDVPWVVADYDTAIMRAVAAMYDEFGVEYRLTPGVGAGGLGPYWPAYLFARDPLQLPLVLGSLGHGGRAHSFDEYYVIEGNEQVYGLTGAEQGYVATIYNYVELMDGPA